MEHFNPTKNVHDNYTLNTTVKAAMFLKLHFNVPITN